jgi:hypothetical protein
MQAYLRLADIPYTLQPCVNASLSPSGKRLLFGMARFEHPVGALWGEAA